MQRIPAQEKLSTQINSQSNMVTESKIITREMVIEEANRLLKPKGETFSIQPENEASLNWLLKYYNPSSQFPVNRKGYIIMGNPGSGKSTLIRVFKNLAEMRDKFFIVDSTEISDRFARKGYGALSNILNKHWTDSGNPYNICIEDIGREEPVTHVENGFSKSKLIDVIPQVIHRLNLKWERKGIRTFGTTNLSDDEIKSRYDARTYSRFRGTFDFIPWGATSESRDFRIEPNKI